MRDYMNAPLIYCGEQHGYQYEKEFSLPSFFLSEHEKHMMHLVAEQCQNIGAFGYRKYRNQADILNKITENKPYSGVRREPYLARLQITGERKSTTVLDYFVCKKDADDVYTYAFFEPDIFISVLIASNLSFRILSPNWLNEYMKKKA